MNHKIAVLSLALIFFATGCSSPTDELSIQEHGEHQRMGSHGMVMFGNSDVSFYHLALYRRPHDRQILTPAQFASAQDKNAFDLWRRQYTDLVTIVPESFDLDRLELDSDNPLTQFVADIYQGHFERGGELKFEKITFELAKPILHRAVEQHSSAELKFTYVINGQAAYFIRDIGPQPGLDLVYESKPIDKLTSGARLEMIENDVDSKLEFVSIDDRRFRIGTKHPLYRETADFE